jgi:hypothetical protein
VLLPCGLACSYFTESFLCCRTVEIVCLLVSTRLGCCWFGKACACGFFFRYSEVAAYMVLILFLIDGIWGMLVVSYFYRLFIAM